MVELANMVKGRCLPRWWGSFLPVTSVSDETFLEMGDWDSMSKMYISMWSRASWHVYLCKARVWKDKSILDKVAAEQKKWGKCLGLVFITQPDPNLPHFSFLCNCLYQY